MWIIILEDSVILEDRDSMVGLLRVNKGFIKGWGFLDFIFLFFY